MTPFRGRAARIRPQSRRNFCPGTIQWLNGGAGGYWAEPNRPVGRALAHDDRDDSAPEPEPGMAGGQT